MFDFIEVRKKRGKNEIYTEKKKLVLHKLCSVTQLTTKNDHILSRSSSNNCKSNRGKIKRFDSQPYIVKYAQKKYLFIYLCEHDSLCDTITPILAFFYYKV